MMISIVICTYNRPKKICELVGMLQKQTLKPKQIIVVDSSDVVNQELSSNNQVDYIYSSHKNQPYQRYLGYLASNSDWLLYLDDDMEPKSEKVIEEIDGLLRSLPRVIALALKFENVQEDTALSAMPKTNINIGNSSFGQIVRFITAYPKLEDGKVGWNGLRGNQPQGGFTEWFSGGSFIAKRDYIFKNFNFGLFNMFEQKIGMGEDFIISNSIAQFGRIWATKDVYFYHNDQKDSTYTPDVYSFNRRVIYSRFFLSIEKARFDQRPKLIAVLVFVYYSFWRGIGLWLNYFINPTRKRRSALNGFINGFCKSFDLINSNNEKQLEISSHYWNNEAKKDLELNNINT